jgi:putative transcriptional regulator
MWDNPGDMTGQSNSGDPASLAPRLLLSMPQLEDPNFRRTVVLLCEHSREGAFGLVLNRPTGVAASEAVQISPPVTTGSTLQLWEGGPVEPQRGWLLLAERPDDTEVLEIHAGLYLSTSPHLLRRLLESGTPSRARILTGYAGWGPGQLDSELAASAWLIADVETDLIFDIEAASMWETAIRRLGADPSSLQMGHGVH